MDIPSYKLVGESRVNGSIAKVVFSLMTDPRDSEVKEPSVIDLTYNYPAFEMNDGEYVRLMMQARVVKYIDNGEKMFSIGILEKGVFSPDKDVNGEYVQVPIIGSPVFTVYTFDVESDCHKSFEAVLNIFQDAAQKKCDYADFYINYMASLGRFSYNKEEHKFFMDSLLGHAMMYAGGQDVSAKKVREYIRQRDAENVAEVPASVGSSCPTELDDDDSFAEDLEIVNTEGNNQMAGDKFP